MEMFIFWLNFIEICFRESCSLQVCISLGNGYNDLNQLEQLERLRFEDNPPPPPPPPPRRLMITHTIESYWIPSQKKTKSKLQI